MFSGFSQAFIALFVAIDILGTLPLFVAMTQDLNRDERIRIVNLSVGVAFIVGVSFVFLGESIFPFLGIDLFDFKVAGGLILLFLALADLVGGAIPIRSGASMGVVPLAVPLLSGPAALTTLIILIHQHSYPITFFALIANYILAWIVLRQSENMTRLVGQEGAKILSKIVTLLLAAIAIAMIRSGLQGIWLQWKSNS